MSPTRTPCLDSSRPRSSRQRATIAVAVTVLAVVPATAASGFWRKPSTGSGSAAADSLVAPGAPTATSDGEQIALTWAPASLQSGHALPSGLGFTYVVRRAPISAAGVAGASVDVACDSADDDDDDDGDNQNDNSQNDNDNNGDENDNNQNDDNGDDTRLRTIATVGSTSLRCVDGDDEVHERRWSYVVVAHLASWTATSPATVVDATPLHVGLRVAGVKGSDDWFRTADVTLLVDDPAASVSCLRTTQPAVPPAPCELTGDGARRGVTLGDGRHHLDVTAANGLRVGDATLDVKIDRTPPTAGPIAGATPGALVTAPVRLALAPTDAASGVASVEWFECAGAVCDPFRAGVRPLARTTEAPFAFTWPPTNATVVGGVHVIAARVTDRAGNRASSEAINLSIDRQPPVVQLTEPADHAVFGRGTVSFASAASDAESGIANVRFEYRRVRPERDDGWTVILDPEGTASAGTADLSGLRNGDYEVRAVAVDGAGNTGTSAVRTVTIRNWSATAMTLANGGGSGTTTNRIDPGDTATFVFSHAPDLASVCPGFTGAAAGVPVTVRVRDGAAAQTDVVAIELCAATPAAPVAPGAPVGAAAIATSPPAVEFGIVTLPHGGYVDRGDAVFDATLAIAATPGGSAAVVVTIGERRRGADGGSGEIAVATRSSVRATFTPNPALQSIDHVVIDGTARPLTGQARPF